MTGLSAIFDMLIKSAEKDKNNHELTTGEDAACGGSGGLSGGTKEYSKLRGHQIGSKAVKDSKRKPSGRRKEILGPGLLGGHIRNK
jgi:hypothetical protein